MIPALVLIFLFSSVSFAGGKKWGKHKGNGNYSKSHNSRCGTPPGLAKQGKVPPGHAKKCQPRRISHYPTKQRGDYPDVRQPRNSGGQNKPTIEGGVDIGVGVHIPFP